VTVENVRTKVQRIRYNAEKAFDRTGKCQYNIQSASLQIEAERKTEELWNI